MTSTRVKAKRMVLTPLHKVVVRKAMPKPSRPHLSRKRGSRGSWRKAEEESL